MTTRFLNFMPFILEWEGGYTNDPDDPGGETNFGIDKRSHPGEDIRHLTRERAIEIYWEAYWMPNGCEDMAPRLGECHMDACVNCGGRRAQQFLFLGGDDWRQCLQAREDFYRRLAEARPSLSKFLKGWLNRTQDLKARLSL